jgi:hypothetical protein
MGFMSLFASLGKICVALSVASMKVLEVMQEQALFTASWSPLQAMGTL